MSTPLQESRRRERAVVSSGKNVLEVTPVSPPDAWDRLLDLCSRRYGEDSQLYGTLKGARLFGVEITNGRLVPPDDYENWVEDRALYFLPYRQEIAALLRSIG